MSTAVHDTAFDNLVIARSRHEIVFIQDNVPDIGVLVAGFGADKEVVILDSARDGLRQIADALAGREGIDALHIVAHGAQGRIELGGTTLDANNLVEHRELLQDIGRSMTDSGDILLYGCDTGAGDNGRALVEGLAIATGADIAASSDLTGSTALGGDWDLEVRSGDIEASVAVDPALAALYQQTLLIPDATVSFNDESRISSPTFGYGAGQDIVYQLSGPGNYGLKVDGKDRSVVTYGSGSLLSDYGNAGGESMLTLSFVGNQVFTAQSLKLANWNGFGPSQKILFKGYDAQGNQVGSTHTLDISNQGMDFKSLTFTGLTNIARLTLTADPSSNGGKMFSIAIDDFAMKNIQPAQAPAPKVLSVTSPNANGVYGTGATITVAVTFDQAVDVTGTPTLQLETGINDRLAFYQSGSGSNTLLFTYTVQSGDRSGDLNYFSTGSLASSNGTIRVHNGSTDAVLVLPALNTADSLGGSKALVIDGIAPTVAITSNVPTLKAGETAIISFEFSETVYGFDAADIVVSGGSLGALSGGGTTYSATFTPTANTDNGSASITVIANSYTDAAGNKGSAGATPGITVDTRAPATTVATIAFSADTGASASDFVTRVTSQTISGTLSANLAAGETVEVSLDNGATWTQATASVGANTWSLAATLIPGSNVLQVRVSDAAGNHGVVRPQAYTVDVTAPAAPTTPDLATGSDTGLRDDDDITGDTTPTFTGTAEAGASVALYSGGVKIGSGTASSIDGKWSITTGTLADGTYNVTARATDLAGNEGPPSAALAVTISTTAPATRNAEFTLRADSGIDGDLVTNVAAQLLAGTLTAPLVAGERVQVQMQAGGEWQTATATAGSAAWSLNTTLQAGTQDVRVRVVNAVGNEGPPAAYAVTLDTVAPTVTITSDKAQLKAGETATVTFTFSEDPGASFSWDGSAGDLKVGGGTLSALSGSGTLRTATFTPDAGVDNGLAGIVIGAGAFHDLAGNANASAAQATLTFDTRAPAAPSAPVLAAASDTGVSSTDGITFIDRPTFTGSAESGATVTLYDTNGSAIGSGVAVGGAWSIAPVAALGEGRHTISARAVDAAGNESQAALGREITIDRTAPTLAITSNVDRLKSGETATITFSFSEDPGASFTHDDIAVSGGKLGVLVKDGLTFSAAFTPTEGVDGTKAGITVGAGAYTDAAGNKGGAGMSPQLLIDTRAPAAPSVPDLEAASDTGASDSDDITGVTTPAFTGTAEIGATVRLYIGNTLIGQGVAADGTWHIASTVALDGGTHQVSARAIDAAGNESPLSNPLSVTVVTAAPATRASIATLSSDTGVSQADFITRDAAQTIAGTLDAALRLGERVEVSLDDGKTWSIAHSGTPGTWSIATVLEEGTHAITTRVVDAIGNSGPVTTQAYQLDTTAPGVAIASDVATLKAGDTAAITFSFSEAPVGFSAADIVVKGGTLGPLSGGGTTWRATFTPQAGVDAGSASISVGAGSYADLAGNGGSAGAGPTLAFDTLAPAAPGAPMLAAGSDTGVSGTDGITANNRPTFTGSAESGATVTLYDAEGKALGSGTAVDGAWSIAPAAALADGRHVVSARAADAAGNVSDVAPGLAITVDTTAPTLVMASSATNLKIGETAVISFTFSEDPGTSFSAAGISVAGGTLGALVRDGLTFRAVFTPAEDAGGATASIAVNAGAYGDAAGNASAASDPLRLTVAAATPEPAPPTVVDGVPVTVAPVTLPGGVAGTSISVPLVTGARVETDGIANLADIPLAASGGQTQLLAQLPVGYGLSASGASVGQANGLELLIAAIRAATPTHAAGDQGHLVGSGAAFLAGLEYSALLVQTITPVATAGSTGALVLSGFDPSGGQGTALVIDTAGLSAGASLQLQNIDFAAIIGATTVSALGGGATLAGDGASQHFSVLGGGGDRVFAGGGGDILGIAPRGAGSATGNSSAMAVAGDPTLLHGGQALDTATFFGQRGDYQVDLHNGYALVSHNGAPDVKALVVNVETLRFDDGDIAIENGAGLATLAGMYQTVFGRQADLYGFEFWADHRDNGVSWGTIALEMIGSSERLASQGGFTGDSANDIGLLYQALLERAPDAAGLAYWQAAMANGMSLEQVASNFVASAEIVGHQRGALDWDFSV